jgi:cytochrome c oxidase assembly protein subunit 15
VLLAVATFPLLFVGAMVTTRKAGMAVPDWPTTYGYNMFLYPLASWFAAPWNVFVEHGHRLFGALVGLLTIALLISLWLCERRPWVVKWGVMLLMLVIAQGVVGGKRVTENSTLLAQIHGCLGPLFFATVVAACVFTSRVWRRRQQPAESPLARRVQSLAWLTTLLAYAQLTVGSELRHIPADASPDTFRIAVWFHLLLATAVMVHCVLVFARVFRLPERMAPLRWPAAALLLLVVVQIGLGCATWLLKYGWPSGLPVPQSWMDGWTNVAGTFVQSVIITAHVAVGSLIVGVSLVAALFAHRLLAPAAVPARGARPVMEVAR